MTRAAIWVAMLALFLNPLVARAQDRPVLAAADLRQGIDLSGPWHWSIDPYRDGQAGFHGGEPGPNAQRYADRNVEQIMHDDPRALFEFDLGQSPTVSLPASWRTHAPEMKWYRGLVWYQRQFGVQPRAGKRYFLRFGAANYRASVWVNGKRAGDHSGGFTPFAFDVTALLKSGDNQVTMGVDSDRTAADVPSLVTDWETFGGITRPIRLIEVADTYVDDAWVRLSDDGRIVASGRIDGPDAGGSAVQIAIPALKLMFNAVAYADGNWSSSVKAPAGLARWSPDNPELYAVEVSTGDDRWHDRIGFRTLAVRGHQILLNGKPIFLAGICLHEEEFSTDPTRAITPATARALLSEVKQGLHGNYVRLAHYPHSEVMTRMADELGLIVWSEIPVYWQIAWDNPETLATARTMLAENIRRDRNRASIALWSVGNETPVGDARTAFLRTLIGDVRALDDSRLVTAALLSGRKGDLQTIDDPLVNDLDVMAVNTYNGWYSDDPLADVPAIHWAVPVDKPLIFSEFGAGALAGFHDNADSPHKFSEEFQADYYRATLKMIDQVSFVAGLSPWILKDFRSPRRQHPVYQQGWNRKGLVSETGQRKAAFDVLADYYAKRTTP